MHVQMTQDIMRSSDAQCNTRESPPDSTNLRYEFASVNRAINLLTIVTTVTSEYGI